MDIERAIAQLGDMELQKAQLERRIGNDKYRITVLEGRIKVLRSEILGRADYVEYLRNKGADYSE